MNDSAIEVWLRMYDEQVRQARHHETSRTSGTKIIMGISAAIFAFLFSNYQDLTGLQYVYTGFLLFVINVYGFVLSLKHYERNRFHTTIAREYRKVLSQKSDLAGKKIGDVRDEAKDDHKKREYRWTYWMYWIYWMEKIRLHCLWCLMHVIAAIVGFIILDCGCMQQFDHSLFPFFPELWSATVGKLCERTFSTTSCHPIITNLDQ